MRESAFQKRVIRLLNTKLRNKPAFFWKASDRFIAGIPDIMGVYDGHMWGIELKVGKRVPTKLQTLTLKALTQAGASIAVCYSLEEVEEFIDDVMKRGGNDVQ